MRTLLLLLLALILIGACAEAQTLTGERLGLTYTFRDVLSSADVNMASLRMTVYGNQDYEYAALAGETDCAPQYAINYALARPICSFLHGHANLFPTAAAGTWELRSITTETRNLSLFDVVTGYGYASLVETTPGSTGRFLSARGMRSDVSARGGFIGDARAYTSGGQIWTHMDSYVGFYAEHPLVPAGGTLGQYTAIYADDCSQMGDACIDVKGPTFLRGDVWVLMNGVMKRAQPGPPDSCGIGKRCLMVDN